MRKSLAKKVSKINADIPGSPPLNIASLAFPGKPVEPPKYQTVSFLLRIEEDARRRIW